MNINEKNIFITGSRKGIGFSLAQEFAQKNCHLYLIQRSFDNQQKEKLLNLGAASVTQLEFDLAKPQQIEQLITKLFKFDIDVFINNAGLLTGGLIENQKPEDIQDMFQVNLHAPIRMTQALIPQMLKRKTGKIINNCSVSSIMHFPCASTYAAAKAALFAFTNCIELELQGTGVTTLNLITPGIKTDMFDDIAERYGKNLEVPKDFITAEHYAKQILKAIETDQTILWPSGKTWFGLKTAQYFPQLFKMAAFKQFHRN